MVNYPHWVQKLLYYRTQHEDGRHIDFRPMSISEADYVTARRLSAYMSSRALATTTTSSFSYFFLVKFSV